MKNLLFILFLVFIFSCKNDELQTKKTLLEYTKKQVRNSNSVVIHDYTTYVKKKNAEYDFQVTKSIYNYITDSTINIDYLYSSVNKDGVEVFRKVWADLDDNDNISRTFPENIDVENGHLTGMTKLHFGNLITNKGFQNNLNGSEILLVSLDTLRGSMFYKTKVNNGSLDINNILPGNYALKIINRRIDLKDNLNKYRSNNLNYFILLNIKGIMDFYEIYFGIGSYGFRNKKLFDETLNENLNLDYLDSDIYYTDQYVESIWNDFTESANYDFIKDFKISFDYKFPVEFKKIDIIPNEITREDVKISYYCY